MAFMEENKAPEIARVLRAVIYARISNDRVGAGLGVKRQEADCRALADRLAAQWGVTIVIVAVLSDNDVSAYSGRGRRDYQRLCNMIATGEADLVLAWHGDRLHRSVRELEDYIDLSNSRNVPTWTVTAGDYDLTTSNGRFQARLAGVIARRESEHRSERVRAAAAQRALAGKFSGGIRPFGFEADGKTVRSLLCPSCMCSQAGFSTVMAAINSRGIPVVPVSEVVKYYT